MTTDRPAEYLAGQVRELCKLPQETEWAEFKVNNSEPREIGEYLSALANSAALAGKAFAYLVWGVADGDHAIVGTRFAPGTTKVGNEELESWLLRLLTPKIHFRFFEVTVDAQPIVLLEIERAFRHPVQFQGLEYIRVGSYKKKLKDFPEKERALWRIFDRMPFENGIVAERVSDEEVIRLLDCTAYFDLLDRPLPDSHTLILKALNDDSLILRCDAGGWNITNLGAMLFAKRLNDFSALQRKAMRVIQYSGASRVETLKEQVGGRGYACGFEGLIGYIDGLLPSNEVIEQALRKKVPRFPSWRCASSWPTRSFIKTSSSPALGRWWRSSRIASRSPTRVCRWSTPSASWILRPNPATRRWHRCCAAWVSARSAAAVGTRSWR